MYLRRGGRRRRKHGQIGTLPTVYLRRRWKKKNAVCSDIGHPLYLGRRWKKKKEEWIDRDPPHVFEKEVEEEEGRMVR